ncbi:MAG: hypothetical protein HRT57_02585 [Crocinitomicaceae bacterium]|nr:hypothetical protein [Crocinitomicaceae bacterium]
MATLIIPLLPFFSSEELNITLLDIHQESIDNAEKIAAKLGYLDFFQGFLVRDATKYMHGKPIDVLITETMDKALTKEPQVSITKNLAHQISENGMLIPEKITLYHEHVLFAELLTAAVLDDEKRISNMPTSGKLELFSIDKNIEAKDFEFQSTPIEVPKIYNETPDICIQTEIKIYADVFLHPTESIITNPYCVGALSSIKGSNYQLEYVSAPEPIWIIKK